MRREKGHLMVNFSFKPLRDAANGMREMREKTGLNQTKFWKQFGVTQSGGSRYENKRKMPKQLIALIRIRYPNVR